MPDASIPAPLEGNLLSACPEAPFQETLRGTSQPRTLGQRRIITRATTLLEALGAL
jgi:hypothetical protein